MKIKWERHDFDNETRTTFKAGEGEFNAKTLHGAKIEATHSSGGVKGHWKLIRAKHAFSMKGRTYIKQPSGDSDITYASPYILLTIMEENDD